MRYSSYTLLAYKAAGKASFLQLRLVERFFLYLTLGNQKPFFFHHYTQKHLIMAHKNQPRKVLIIEDEGDMCLLLNIMLNGKEMELDHVKNIAKAEEYLQETQPALVILDNKLPDGYGVDFIPTIKQQQPEAKIIMISGFDGSVKDVALENGADIFMEKPFTKSQLYDSIMSLMNTAPTAVE